MKEYKYNVKPSTIGVYMITCTINNKKYVGSSNNVSSRIGQHFRKKVCKGTRQSAFGYKYKYSK